MEHDDRTLLIALITQVPSEAPDPVADDHYIDEAMRLTGQSIQVLAHVLTSRCLV